MNTQRINENIGRLAITLCQRDAAKLRLARVSLILVAPLFAELVDAIEANPVGITPPFMSALATLRESVNNAPPAELVDVVRLTLTFGDFVQALGAALRSDGSPALWRAIGKCLVAVASDLDADTPATAEVLQQIGDQLLESELDPSAGGTPQV